LNLKVTYKPVNGEASIWQEHHGLSRILEAVFPSLTDDPQASRIDDPLSISLFFSSNMQESCKHTTDSLCRIAQDAAADDLY